MLPAERPVKADGTGTRRCQPQIREAIKNRDLAAVDQREKAHGQVDPEIRHGHLAAQDERGGPGEQSQDDERSAEGFKDSRYAHQRGEFRLVAAQSSEPSEEFLVAVQREGESHDDPEQRAQVWFVTGEVHP